MISIRSPIGAVALLAVILAASFATMAAARHDHHDHHDHDGWRFSSLWHDGKQTQSEAITNCLCWNATSNNWCHHPLDGSHTGFFRDSCARAISFNFIWLVPVIVWCMYLIVLPVFFAIFRLCCNCCGGRTPSFGCCCPISNRILSLDPKWVRPYSRCSTWFAKLLALAVFVAFLTLSIHALVANHQVSLNIQHTASGLTTMVDGINGLLSSSMTTAESYVAEGWWNFDVAAVKAKLASAEDELHHISHHLSTVNRHEVKYAANPIYNVVGVVLALVTLVTLLAACNVRSWPISIAAGLLSFLTVLLVLLASVTMTASIGLKVACDHPELVQNLTTQLFTSNGYCGMSDVTTGINATQVAYAKLLCRNVPANMKANLTSDGVCEERIGGMFTNTSVGMEGATVVDAAKINSLLMKVSANVNASKATKDMVALVKAGSFVFGYKAYYSNVAILTNGHYAHTLQSLFVLNYKCNIVSSQFQSVVQPLACGAVYSCGPGVMTNWWSREGNSRIGQCQTERKKQLPHSIQRLAALLWALSAIATVAFWVYVHGSKRFTKAATKEELSGHHTANYNQQQQMMPGHLEQGDVYDNGCVAKAPAAAAQQEEIGAQPANTNAAVTNTTAEPLLLRHDAPNYTTAMSQPHSVNQLTKEQPETV